MSLDDDGGLPGYLDWCGTVCTGTCCVWPEMRPCASVYTVRVGILTMYDRVS